MEVKRENNIYSINQKKFINKIASAYGLSDAKPSKIPLDPGYEKNQQNQPLLPSNVKYQKLIGSLLFIALNTRPDIESSIILLAQKVTQPTEYDWEELKRVVIYLKTTKGIKLNLASQGEEEQLVGYADASWGQDRSNGKSMSGYLFKLNGGVVSWSSRKQNCVALSSTEAELIALTECTKEAIWLKKLLSEINFVIHDKILIFEDNQSVTKMIISQNHSSRTKHVNVRYHFIKDYIERNIITIEYCETENMIADILTKPLNRVKFEKFRVLLGLSD